MSEAQLRPARSVFSRLNFDIGNLISTHLEPEDLSHSVCGEAWETMAARSLIRIISDNEWVEQMGRRNRCYSIQPPDTALPTMALSVWCGKRSLRAAARRVALLMTPQAALWILIEATARDYFWTVDITWPAHTWLHKDLDAVLDICRNHSDTVEGGAAEGADHRRTRALLSRSTSYDLLQRGILWRIENGHVDALSDALHRWQSPTRRSQSIYVFEIMAEERVATALRTKVEEAIRLFPDDSRLEKWWDVYAAFVQDARRDRLQERIVADVRAKLRAMLPRLLYSAEMVWGLEMVQDQAVRLRTITPDHMLLLSEIRDALLALPTGLPPSPKRLYQVLKICRSGSDNPAEIGAHIVRLVGSLTEIMRSQHGSPEHAMAWYECITVGIKILVEWLTNGANRAKVERQITSLMSDLDGALAELIKACSKSPLPSRLVEAVVAKHDVARRRVLHKTSALRLESNFSKAF